MLKLTSNVAHGIEGICYAELNQATC